MITECVCSTVTDAKLDVKTNKVLCQNPKCGKEILLTEFMKTTMKQNGDIIRNSATDNKIPEGGMQVECDKCDAKFPARLNKKDNEVYCVKCDQKLNLSAFTKALLRENGMYSDRKETIVSNDLDLSGESEKQTRKYTKKAK